MRCCWCCWAVIKSLISWRLPEKKKTTTESEWIESIALKSHISLICPHCRQYRHNLPVFTRIQFSCDCHNFYFFCHSMHFNPVAHSVYFNFGWRSTRWITHIRIYADKTRHERLSGQAKQRMHVRKTSSGANTHITYYFDWFHVIWLPFRISENIKKKTITM